MKHAFKKIMALVLAIVMIVGVLPSAFAANLGDFTDVKNTDWFAEYVEYVVFYDYMNGTSATTFEPNSTCTRAMAATVLYRLEGSPVVYKASTFMDLTQDWYKNAVAWAQAAGVVNGIDGTHFAPNGLLTREQLVTMIWRYAGSVKVEGDNLSAFPDAKSVSAYAVDAFNWAIQKGIINGKDGKLDPQGNATRAEFAKIITVFDKGRTPCTEHKWDSGKITKEPTCTEKGEKTFTCTECGATKVEEVSALGHDYVDGKCSRCGVTLAAADEIVIYYTNDVHTYIDKALSYDNIADLNAQTKKVAAGTLLLDAGDHIQGTYYGTTDDDNGKKIIEMMNAAGYDAATLGNHEFDYGMARALNLVKEADFPYLSCNFYEELNGVKGKNVLDSYKIFEVGGKKIAIIGVTTPESFTKSTPKYFQNENGEYIYGIAGGSDGSALYASVQAAIDAAKAENPDYIIALGHCGDDVSSKPWTSEEVIANTTGLDAWIDGHSHSTVPMKEVTDKGGNTVVLTQTGSYFNAIGKMTIKDGKIATELIKSYSGSDATTAALKNEWIAHCEEILGKVVAYSEVEFNNFDKDGKRLVRKQETNTGDFAADALYYLFTETNDLHADAAIMNGGGVRNEKVTGDLSGKSFKSIHTFGNVACLIEVSGQQILDALEWGARDSDEAECGGFLQVSGITYEIHTYVKSTVQKDEKGVWTAGPTGEYRVKNVKIGGEPLDVNKTYRLAGYNYTLRDLGDGFAMFKGATNVLDYVMTDWQVLQNYALSFPKSEKHNNLPTIPADSKYAEVTGEGRITFVREKTVESDVVYTLASELKDGDEVIIYNPGYGKAIKNENDNNWYLVAQEVTPANNEIKTDDTTIVWTAKKNDDGTFSFVNGDNAITAWLSGTYIELTNDANYDGGDTKWNVATGTAANNTFYISSSTIAGSYGPGYLECYPKTNKVTGETVDKICGYSTSSPKEKDCGFQFFVKGGTTPAPGPDPVPGNVYTKATELKEGDEVIIVCEAKNVALSGEYNGFYNKGTEVTPADGKIETDDTTIVWTVGKEGDFYTFSYNGQKIGMGTSYTSMTLGGVNYKWQVEAAATAGSFYVKNLDRDPEKAYYMQWYETNGNWSGYHTLNEELMALSFYVKGGETPVVCNHVWNDGVVTTPATCTAAGVKTYTCTKCGETKTETIPATGHNYVNGVCTACGAKEDVTPGNVYTKTTELKEGDEVIIVCDAKNIALSGEYQGFYNKGTEVAPADGKIETDDTTIVWTVGKEGDFYTFSYNGQKIGMGTSYTSMTLGGVNYKWQVEAAATAGSFYVKNLDRDPEKAYYMQWYETNGNWSGYHTLNEELMALSFYVKGGETPVICDHVWNEGVVTTAPTCTTAGVKTYTCTKCTATKTEVVPATGHNYVNGVCTACGAKETVASEAVYALATELKDGDEVIIVNAEAGKAMSEDAVATKYRAGVDVVPEDDKITTDDSKIVWDVIKTDDGYKFMNDDGETLSATSGLSFADTDNVWSLTAGTAADTFIISSTTAKGNSGDPKSIEWYANYSEFSTFYKNDSNESLFAMKFYVKDENAEVCDHDWQLDQVIPATCTEAGETDYICSKCNAEKEEPIAALGHVDDNKDGKCDRCGTDLGGTSSGYTKVTTALADWSGTYLIVFEKTDTTAYAFNGLDKSGNFVETTFANNTIAASEALTACEVLVEASGTGYTFKLTGGENSGKYLTALAGSNKIVFSDTAKALSVAMENGTVVIKDGEAPFQFNNGSTNGQWFRFFGKKNGGQSAIALYKLG